MEENGTLRGHRDIKLTEGATLEDIIQPKSYFKVKTANEWIEESKKKPVPKMLFDEFWHEGEICILFANTGVGKSILSVQIGESIARGEAITGFRLEANPQPVLYFDFELSDKQFENRYSENYTNHYDFSDNFLRCEIDSDFVYPEDFDYEDHLFTNFEQIISEKEVPVIIVDNVTWLSNENEKSKFVGPLMKTLKALKSKFGLSILVLAHTPKRDLTKPITINDISGSKLFANFTDSSFAIGQSFQDDKTKYIKQIKERNKPKKYGAENVVICRINNSLNFTKFEFVDLGKERDHLRELTENDRAQRDQEILNLSQQGFPNTQIADKLSCNEKTVRNVLKRIGSE